MNETSGGIFLACVDLETFLIEPGGSAPPLVCAGWTVYDDGKVKNGLVTVKGESEGDFHGLIDALILKLFDDVRTQAAAGRVSRFVNQNIPFDFGVLCQTYPHLIPHVFAMYDEGLVDDTMIREQLTDIAAGSLGWVRGIVSPRGTRIRRNYTLKDMAKRRLDVDMDKTTWRMGYADLIDVPLARWPQGAKDYAVDDTGIAIDVYLHQRGEVMADLDSGEVPNSLEQCRAHWSLHLMSLWGIRTEGSKVARYKHELDLRLGVLADALSAVGFIRGGGIKGKKAGSKDKKLIEETILELNASPLWPAGHELARTEKGAVAMTAAAMDDLLEALDLNLVPAKAVDKKEPVDFALDLARSLPSTPGDTVTDLDGHPVPKKLAALALLAWHTSTQKTLGTYIPPLEAGAKYPINCRYQPLVESGRTSCVIGSTKITTDKGTFAISDMQAMLKKQNLQVWTHEGRWRPVLRVFRRGKAPMYRVKTDSGPEIICSKKHRFLTETGWKHLRNMKVGDRIATENKAYERAGVRSVFFDRKADVARAEDQVRGEQGSFLLFPEVLATEIRRRFAVDQLVSILCGSQSSQEELSRSKNHFESGDFAGSAGRAFPSRDDGREVGCECLYLAEKHSVPWPTARSAGTSRTDGVAKKQSGAVRGFGVFYARYFRSRIEAAKRSSGFFLQAVRRTFEVAGNGLLREPAWEGAWSLLLKNNTQGCVLEHEQVRGPLSYRVAREGNTASATSYCRADRTGSAVGGFLGERNLVRRSGWRFPRAGKADQKRSEEGGVYEANENTASADTFGSVGEGSRKGGPKDREHISFDRIASVESYGVETVWDLSVEEDESYLAEGFYNHNCSSPNLQNLPKERGVRECYRARPGTVFSSVDYEALELHTLAQACLTLVGKSKLAEALNEGVDPHLLLAVQFLLDGITYDEGKKIRKDEGHPRHKEVIHARNMAKIANFGLPGALSAKTLVRYAKAGGIIVDLDAAMDLKAKWFKAWPEMKDYFKKIGSLLYIGDVGEEVGTAEQLFSARMRGGARYTALCNTMFQGLAADLAKVACYEVAKACYVPGHNPILFGSRSVVFVHDEIIMEHPIETAHERAMEQARIMIEAGRAFCPDVPLKAEPALMHFWTKDAVAVYDENKRLIPWVEK